jgi:hypothetical protein
MKIITMKYAKNTATAMLVLPYCVDTALVLMVKVSKDGEDEKDRDDIDHIVV